MMTTPDLIARITERFPDLATVEVPVHRAAEESHRAEMARVIAAGVGGKLNPSAAGTLSQEAVNQAGQYLQRENAEHVLDGIAHQVFNVLRGTKDDIDGAKYDDVRAAIVEMGVVL
jgi:hypothetical protein